MWRWWPNDSFTIFRLWVFLPCVIVSNFVLLTASWMKNAWKIRITYIAPISTEWLSSGRRLLTFSTRYSIVLGRSGIRSCHFPIAPFFSAGFKTSAQTSSSKSSRVGNSNSEASLPTGSSCDTAASYSSENTPLSARFRRLRFCHRHLEKLSPLNRLVNRINRRISRSRLSLRFAVYC